MSFFVNGRFVHCVVIFSLFFVPSLFSMTMERISGGWVTDRNNRKKETKRSAKSVSFHRLQHESLLQAVFKLNQSGAPLTFVPIVCDNLTGFQVGLNSFNINMGGDNGYGYAFLGCPWSDQSYPISLNKAGVGPYAVSAVIDSAIAKNVYDHAAALLFLACDDNDLVLSSLESGIVPVWYALFVYDQKGTILSGFPIVVDAKNNYNLGGLLSNKVTLGINGRQVSLTHQYPSVFILKPSFQLAL